MAEGVLIRTPAKRTTKQRNVENLMVHLLIEQNDLKNPSKFISILYANPKTFLKLPKLKLSYFFRGSYLGRKSAIFCLLSEKLFHLRNYTNLLNFFSLIPVKYFFRMA